MALTKEQIKAKLLPKQLAKRTKAVVWGDVVSAVASASTEQKNLIVSRLKVRDYNTVGRILSEILMSALKSEVDQALDQALANNSLNLDELSDILQ